MEPLKTFLSQNASKGEVITAYVSLNASTSLLEVARKLSALLEMTFQQASNFDECSAFLGRLNDHDVTILMPKADKLAHRCEIMIEPGHNCDARGSDIDLSVELANWLSRVASSVGQFSPL